MPNYEDFKKYGEMDKQKKAQPSPAPEPAKKAAGLSKLFGKAKSKDR